jgi:hypothetical protein
VDPNAGLDDVKIKFLTLPVLEHRHRPLDRPGRTQSRTLFSFKLVGPDLRGANETIVPGHPRKRNSIHWFC